MRTILEWLEDSAVKYPDKIAFGDVDAEISFNDLVLRSKAVATAILKYTTPGKPVAFYMEKSVVGIIGMFAVVYVRGAYSMLDIKQPADRLQKVLSVLDSELILTDKNNCEKAESLGFEGNVLCIEELLGSDIDNDALQEIRKSALDIDPLYINFTSGSTGTPKGVAVCHRSVIDFIPHFSNLFGIDKDDVIGNQAPFDFDVSVKDIYTGLYTGAKVQIIPKSFFTFPVKLMDYLCEKQVTTLTWAVSAMCFVSIMKGFEYKTPTTIKRVLFSGEVLPIKHYKHWKQFLPDAMFVNLYGPTEITCNCTYYIVDREFEDGEVMPIGITFPNEKVFLLDENDCLITEPGVRGEICVSGTAVALGYYKDKERTESVFRQNPLNQAYPERIYCTGDLGMYDENGQLVYCSRKDFQIKHLGHRIELGEIEAVAMGVENISRTCCLYDHNKQMIYLFYTGECEKKEVSRYLRKKLPPFMLPNSTIKVDEMPMNKNGKIDRNALKELK